MAQTKQESTAPEYGTFDTDFAAYLHMLDYKIVRKVYVGRRVKFFFEDDGKIAKLRDDFVMAKAEGNIAAYNASLKEIRALINEARESGY